MRLQYKLSAIFSALILLLGFAMIFLNYELLNQSLEQNMLDREKIALKILEARLFPYMVEKDYISATEILFDEKGINKDLVEYIAVYDRDNNLVAHTFLGDIPGEIYSLGQVKTDFEKKELVINNRPIIDAGMDIDDESSDSRYIVGYIHIGYKKSYIYAIVSMITGTLTLAIIIITIITILVSIWISKNFVKPVKSLTNSALEISEGNLDAEIHVESKDEIGELADSFRKMTKDLSKSHDDLREYSRQLEEKVNERTKELNHKMEEIDESKSAILNIMEDLEREHEKTLRSEIKLKETVNSLRIAEYGMKSLNLKLARTNNQLVKADQMKTEFMSVASHELKTPITSIMGFSELLQNESIAGNPEMRKKYLSIIVDESRHMSGLISDILDMSRIDSGTMKFMIEKTDLNTIALEVKNELEIITAKKSISLSFEKYDNLPEIECDRKRIKQIMINLVNNAFKFTPQGGSIKIHTYRNGPMVCFDVTDTGIGIPGKFFRQIFQRFFQVDGSATRDAGGVGLGLSISKGIVEAHGGNINFKSKVGKGTTFTVALPLKIKKSPEKEFGNTFRKLSEHSRENVAPHIR